jgi:hypothetical protein
MYNGQHDSSYNMLGVHQFNVVDIIDFVQLHLPLHLASFSGVVLNPLLSWAGLE